MTVSTRPRLLLTAGLLTGALTSLVACGGGGGGGAGGAAARGDITIAGFAYGPADFTATPGQVVRVANQDKVAHDLKSDGGLFRTPALAGGTSATFVAPSKPGSYPYTCTFHPDMHGTLTVR